MGRSALTLVASLLILQSVDAPAAGLDGRACSLISKADLEAVLLQPLSDPKDTSPGLLMGSHPSLHLSSCDLSLTSGTGDISLSVWFAPFEVRDVEPRDWESVIRAINSGFARDVSDFGKSAIWMFYGGPFSDPSALPWSNLYIFTNSYILSIGVKGIQQEGTAFEATKVLGVGAVSRLPQ